MGKRNRETGEMSMGLQKEVMLVLDLMKQEGKKDKGKGGAEETQVSPLVMEVESGR